jgi:cobalt-zinc-cadmium resistance protein CzcA
MKSLITGVFAMLTIPAFAQEKMLSLSQAIDEALKNNSTIRAAYYNSESQRQLTKTIELPKTEVTLAYGQYNSFERNDNNISVTQSIPFTAFGSQASVQRAMSKSLDDQKVAIENEIVWQVKRTYYQLLYTKAFGLLLQREDSLFRGFANAASARYRTGESRHLEKSTADQQLNEVQIRIGQNEVEEMNLRSQLMVLLNVKELPEIDFGLQARQRDITDTSAWKRNPSLSYAASQVNVADSERKLQQARFAPDLQVGIFSQTLIGTVDADNGNVASGGDRFTGFQVGLALPLWFGPHRARVKAAEFTRLAAESKHVQLRETIRSQVNETARQLSVQQRNIDYYEKTALPNADTILRQSQIAFREGEIDYPEFLFSLRNSISVKENYLKALNDYNQSIIYLEYLTGQK